MERKLGKGKRELDSTGMNENEGSSSVSDQRSNSIYSTKLQRDNRAAALHRPEHRETQKKNLVIA